MKTARIFTNGGSQAVRLPKEYQFETDEVMINRVGDAVILFPAESGWKLLQESLGGFSEDYMADRNQPALVAEDATKYTPRRGD
jgi:antitoxin VapB